MRVEILQELLEAIERCDWTGAMTIGRAALEQASKIKNNIAHDGGMHQAVEEPLEQMSRIERGAPSYSQREQSGQYFDETYKSFG
jgi:hypothetical protein